MGLHSETSGVQWPPGSFADNLREVWRRLSGDAKQERHGPVQEAAAEEGRPGQNNETALGLEDTLRLVESLRIKNIFCGEGGDQGVERFVHERKLLGYSTSQVELRVDNLAWGRCGGTHSEPGETCEVISGKPTHLGRFVDPHREQVAAQERALQMARAVANFQDPVPPDEGHHAQHPVFPPAQGDRRCDEIVGEGKRVVEQVKEETEESFHDRRRAEQPCRQKNKGLTR